MRLETHAWPIVGVQQITSKPESATACHLEGSHWPSGGPVGEGGPDARWRDGVQVGCTERGPAKSAWGLHLPRWHVLGASPGLSSLLLPPLPLQVKAAMYLTYIRAVGVPLGLYALFLFFCQQVASFCCGYWLSLWADDPTVDGRQTQAALRGWVFGLLGCLQGSAHWPSFPCTLSAPPQVLGAPQPAHPWLTLFSLKCPGYKHRPASLRQSQEEWGTGHVPPFLGSSASPPDSLANAKT